MTPIRHLFGAIRHLFHAIRHLFGAIRHLFGLGPARSLRRTGRPGDRPHLECGRFPKATGHLERRHSAPVPDEIGSRQTRHTSADDADPPSTPGGGRRHRRRPGRVDEDVARGQHTGRQSTVPLPGSRLHPSPASCYGPKTVCMSSSEHPAWGIGPGTHHRKPKLLAGQTQP
jgi:hypothetical protein